MFLHNLITFFMPLEQINFILSFLDTFYVISLKVIALLGPYSTINLNPTLSLAFYKKLGLTKWRYSEVLVVLYYYYHFFIFVFDHIKHKYNSCYRRPRMKFKCISRIRALFLGVSP